MNIDTYRLIETAAKNYYFRYNEFDSVGYASDGYGTDGYHYQTGLDRNGFDAVF